MKLTPEQLAEIERGHIGKRFGDNEYTYPRLFEHIRAVEAERDDALAASPEIFLKSFDSETATMELKSEAFRVFAEMAYQYAELLGMKNYLESKVNIRAVAGEERFVFTLQRDNGKTPHELKLEAEAERNDWREMAGRLARSLRVKPFNVRTCDDDGVVAEFDAMVAREGQG